MVNEWVALLVSSGTFGGVTSAIVWVYRYVKKRREKARELEEYRSEQARKIEYIFQQNSPNGGGSMLDKMVRLEFLLNDIDARTRIMDMRSDLMASAVGYATFFADVHGRLLKCNLAMQRQTERSETELLGNGWVNAIDPGVRLEIMQEWALAVRDERIFEQPFAWQHPNHSFLPVRCVAWPTRNGAGDLIGYVGLVETVEMAVYPPPKMEQLTEGL